MWHDLSSQGPIASPLYRVRQPESHPPSHQQPARSAPVVHSGEHDPASAEQDLPVSVAEWHHEVARCWVVREFSGRQDGTGVPQFEDVAWDWVWDDASESWVEPRQAQPCYAYQPPASCSDDTRRDDNKNVDQTDSAKQARETACFAYEVREGLMVLALLLAWYAGSLAILLAVSG